MRCVFIFTNSDDILTQCTNEATWIMPLGKTALCDEHFTRARELINTDPRLEALASASPDYQFKKLSVSKHIGGTKH